MIRGSLPKIPEKKRTRKELEYNKALKLVFTGMRALWFRIEGENYRSYPDAMLIIRNCCSYWELKSENNSVKKLQKKRMKWLAMRGHRVFLLRKHSKYIRITYLERRIDHNKNYYLESRVFEYDPDTPISVITMIMVSVTLELILHPRFFQGGPYEIENEESL